MRSKQLLKISILFVFFLTCVDISNAQEISKTDSLKQKLSVAGDSSDIAILNKLCWEFRNSEIQHSITYGIQSVELAEKYKDYKNLTKAYSFLGVAYRNFGNYTKAFDYYYKGLESAKKYNLIEQEGYAYINIGNLYLYHKYYNDAVLNLDKGLEIAKQINNEKILGYYYLNRGRLGLETNNYSQALQYLTKALDLRSKDKNLERQGICLKYIGDVYNEQNNYKLALKYYKESLDRLEKTSDIDLFADNYNKISNIYLKKGNYKQAFFYAEKGLEMAEKIGSKLRLRNANQTLMQIHKAKKNYKAVFEYQNVVIKYNDSLFNQELNEKISYIKFIDEKYEYDNKLRDLEYEHKIEIEKQKQVKNVSILLSVILIIICFVLFMFFRIKRKVNANLISKNKQIAEHKSELENTLEDIRIANEKLKELNAMKDKFFTIIAHDLKSPFNAIVNFSKLLLKNYHKYDSGKHKKIIKYIHKSGESTYKLLENLLLWSRSQIGNINFSPKEENLYQISIETIELLSHSANSKSITLNNEIPKDIFVKTDKKLYVTILRNLTTNAVKFTPKGRNISIKATTTNENNQSYTEISVVDEGIGISKEKIKKLFNISENISTKGTEDEDGTGIGLMLCKEFVEMHGGQIKIKSKVNFGTTMSFTLPTA
ncbi:MAG: tetratricopeptide repeat-containing sensor histidine kinase [Bacteroidales bacterium]|nr:tetratricopeptide repeat-containing sensor histidine kinase [Bacteroidales bacterium]